MDSEKEFLNSYNKNEYEKPSVAVDLLVFTIKDDRLKIVLVMSIRSRICFPYRAFLWV